jgi:hypothetical protein
MGKQIFISYAHEDSNFAYLIKEHYEKEGNQVFIDYDDITSRKGLSDRIKQSILESDIVVVIVTRGGLASSKVEKEIIEAKNQKKIIIACIYHEIPLNELKWDLNKLKSFKFNDKNSLILQLDQIIFSLNK